MMIIYLSLFLALEVGLKKFAGSTPRLFSQLFFSLFSLVFIFIGSGNTFLSELASRPIDLFLVVTSMVLYGLVKLYLVISTNNREVLDLSIPILIMCSIAIPNTLAKVIVLLLVFCWEMNISNKGVIQIKLAKLICIFIGLFYFVEVINDSSFHTILFLSFLVGAVYMRNLAFIFLVSSIAIGAGQISNWACWVGFGVIIARTLIYILIENQIISSKFSNFKGADYLAASLVRLKHKKQVTFSFTPLVRPYSSKENIKSYQEVGPKKTLADVGVFWTIAFLMIIILSWGF